MFSNLIKISILTLCLGMFITPAFAQYETKDSFYFMKDDGIFSDEEKDEEAEYIKQECEISTLEQQYYNCACIAGAFRLKRNEEKLQPQTTIIYNLYNDRESKCVDTSKIAGNIFAFCKNYADFFRPRKENNQEYCECVANTVATKFSRTPRLKSRYISNLRVNAMGSCDAKLNLK